MIAVAPGLSLAVMEIISKKPELAMTEDAVVMPVLIIPQPKQEIVLTVMLLMAV